MDNLTILRNFFDTSLNNLERALERCKEKGFILN